MLSHRDCPEDALAQRGVSIVYLDDHILFIFVDGLLMVVVVMVVNLGRSVLLARRRGGLTGKCTTTANGIVHGCCITEVATTAWG